MVGGKLVLLRKVSSFRLIRSVSLTCRLVERRCRYARHREYIVCITALSYVRRSSAEALHGGEGHIGHVWRAGYHLGHSQVGTAARGEIRRSLRRFGAVSATAEGEVQRNSASRSFVRLSRLRVRGDDLQLMMRGLVAVGCTRMG